MKVVFTTEAVTDLENIDEFIARNNPRRAVSFLAELIDKARDLAGMAEAFPLVPRYAHLGIRRRPYGNYLIFYRIEIDEISVIHVLHGARDYDGLLFPDE